MFSLRVSWLRYNTGVLGFGLLLLASLAVGQAPGQTQPTNPTSPTGQPAAQAPPDEAPANETASAAAASQQPLPTIEKMDTEASRGGPVTFVGENFPANETEITVLLNAKSAGNARLVSPDRKSFIFVVPSDVELRKYKVTVEIKLKNNPVPFEPTLPPEAMLTVYGEAGKTTPKIIAVSPLLSYPEKEIYGFTVVGEGFSPRGTDNGLVILNGTEIKVCWEDDPNCNSKVPGQVYGKVVSDRQLEFQGIPQKHQGLSGIQIRVGQDYSNPFEITLSRVGRTTPILISLLVFVTLVGLLLFIVSRGLVTKEIAGRKYSLFQSLLLDKETDTYSLSRFQFYVWTAAAILGYLYLMLSRSLVQGRLEFVDIPSGLPGIVLISASTAILAQGITNSKGPKGSGEVHPTIADLVTTGGLAVPERFQFFLWTVLGALVFLFLVFATDPGTIKDLPTIPPGFLEIMGVSSLGYLGGKLARKAGPVIDEIVARRASLELELHGRNLSRDASFRIGSTEVPIAMIDGGKPKIIEGDTEANMAKRLLLKIKDKVPGEWFENGSRLTIINPDGQTACWEYSLTPVEDATAAAAAEGESAAAAEGAATADT